jgi:hypothetical protein
MKKYERWTEANLWKSGVVTIRGTTVACWIWKQTGLRYVNGEIVSDWTLITDDWRYHRSINITGMS